jgi:hypothetical protein
LIELAIEDKEILPLELATGQSQSRLAQSEQVGQPTLAVITQTLIISHQTQEEVKQLSLRA